MARCFRSFLRDYCGWCPGLNQRRNIASTWWITPEGEVESHCEDNREENREKYIFLWLFSLIKLTVYLLSYYFLRKEILLTATLNAFPFFFFFLIRRLCESKSFGLMVEHLNIRQEMYHLLQHPGKEATFLVRLIVCCRKKLHHTAMKKMA